MANTNNRPMSMSASTQPGANGSTASEAIMATRQMIGAARKVGRSALSGMMSSLKKLLTPSAMGWSNPCQPTSIGPRRTCMWPMILRSK